MKIFLSVILVSLALFCEAQPTATEIKKFKIRKVTQKTINADGSSSENTWTYDSKGYDSTTTFYGQTRQIKNTIKNGKLAEKIIIKEDGKNDSYSYDYKPDGSYKETMTDGSFGMKSYEWYDSKKRIIKSQSPDGNTITYKYDAKGKLFSVVSDGKNDGVKIDNRYSYNTKGQLEKLVKTNGNNKSTTTYTYSAKGLASSTVTKGIWEGESFESTAAFEYNEKGLVTKTVSKNGEGSATYAFEYEYY